MDKSKFEFQLGSRSATLRHSFELYYPNLYQQSYFTFRTLAEANQLAAYLCTFYPQGKQKNIEIGLNEVFINAIEHGNLGITFEEKTWLKSQHSWLNEVNQRLCEPKNSGKIVNVYFEKTPSFICVTAKDMGCGFSWEKYSLEKVISSKVLHGRGLLLAQTLSFDKLEFSKQGNEVHCYLFTQPLLNFPSFT